VLRVVWSRGAEGEVVECDGNIWGGAARSCVVLETVSTNNGTRRAVRHVRHRKTANLPENYPEKESGAPQRPLSKPSNALWRAEGSRE
jgi:hypothetical protein